MMQKKDIVSKTDAYSSIKIALYTLISLGETTENIASEINGIIGDFNKSEDITLVSSSFPGMILDSEQKSIGNFSLYPIQHTFSYKGKRVQLSPNETKLMTMYFDKPGVTITYSEITQYVRPDFSYDQSAAEVCRPLQSRLRKKLSEFPNHEKWFDTVRGVGYVFNGEFT